MERTTGRPHLMQLARAQRWHLLIMILEAKSLAPSYYHANNAIDTGALLPADCHSQPTVPKSHGNVRPRSTALRPIHNTGCLGLVVAATLRQGLREWTEILTQFKHLYWYNRCPGISTSSQLGSQGRQGCPCKMLAQDGLLEKHAELNLYIKSLM